MNEIVYFVGKKFYFPNKKRIKVILRNLAWRKNFDGKMSFIMTKLTIYRQNQSIREYRKCTPRERRKKSKKS